MRTIEVLGPGCNNCIRLEKNAREAVAMAGVEAEVVHVTDPREIIAHGIMSTPGLDHRRQGPQLRAHPVGRRHRGLAERVGLANGRHAPHRDPRPWVSPLRALEAGPQA